MLQVQHVECADTFGARPAVYAGAPDSDYLQRQESPK
jgi:hypothetical protein